MFPLTNLQLNKMFQSLKKKNPILHMCLRLLRLLVAIREMVRISKMAHQGLVVGAIKIVMMSV